MLLIMRTMKHTASSNPDLFFHSQERVVGGAAGEETDQTKTVAEGETKRRRDRRDARQD